MVDLLLIRDRFYPALPPATVRAACVDVFGARADEAAQSGQPGRTWPPELVVPNDEWPRAYPALAEAVGIALTFEQAMAELGDWIAAIETRGVKRGAHYVKPERDN